MHPAGTRPTVTELRLSAFKAHRGLTLPLAPLTLLTGQSGSGKSGVLQAYGILARLSGGALLPQALTGVAGGAAACVPEGARPDGQGRRGFRIGCTIDGPAGPVTLDVAVQAEPEPRIVGERLTAGGLTLLSTALTDPDRRAVQAAWYTAGATPVTRAPLPDDRLSTALLPLRVAGKTEGQRLVLSAAEQVVVALRSGFVCDPRPEAMRGTDRGAAPARGAGAAGRSAGASGRGPGAPGRRGAAGAAESPGGTGEADGRLRTTCDNLPAVLRRTSQECARRHAALVDAVRAGCSGPIEGLVVAPPQGDDTRVRALIDRGARGTSPLERLGDGELRYLALALVLLTGPGVLEMDPAGEVPSARQVLTVVADGLDRCLDRRQARELLTLAVRMTERGHIRLLGVVGDASPAEGLPGVRVLHLDA
ncbi:biotin transporter BioY [Streptomyces sp. NPDC003077]|uniref:biotin transporter BioY n=1 Tax=Streptomyces sp. NPDC003077 TaxID=3154443 RepID=UPI0033B122F4